MPCAPFQPYNHSTKERHKNVKKILATTYIIASISIGCAFAASFASPSQAGTSSGTATENSAEKQVRYAVVAQIVAASGMDELLEQFPTMVAMGFDQQPPPLVEQEAFYKFRDTLLHLVFERAQ